MSESPVSTRAALAEPCLHCGAEREHYCIENGYAMPFFHADRIEAARTRAGKQRARFIDRDGRSFFGEVGPNKGRWFLREMVLNEWHNEVALSARAVCYLRELWRIPIGPIACPLQRIEIEDDERIDVVYRYESD